MMIPYEIWVTGTDGRKQFLAGTISDSELTDEQVKDLVKAELADRRDKITTPGADTLTIERGIIAPNQWHIRVWRRSEEIDGYSP